MGYWRSAVVLVHFPENGNHGCGKKCSFCPFEQMNYNIPIEPTDDEVLNFISNVQEGGKIQICGAGDPLFNFEKNKDYLLHLIELIHLKGYKIELVTKYTEVIEEYADILLPNINAFCFSVEALNKSIFNLIDKITSLEKYVRISKVANFTADIHNINWDFIERYVKFYGQIKHKENFSVCLRPNFNFDYSNEELYKERLKAAELGSKYGYRVYMHIQGKYLKTPQLWNGRQIACGDTQKYIKIDMGLE